MVIGIRFALAFVGGLFLWFFLGKAFEGSPDKDTIQLLGVAAYGFAMAALIIGEEFVTAVRTR